MNHKEVLLGARVKDSAIFDAPAEIVRHSGGEIKFIRLDLAAMALGDLLALQRGVKSQIAVVKARGNAP